MNVIQKGKAEKSRGGKSPLKIVDAKSDTATQFQKSLQQHKNHSKRNRNGQEFKHLNTMPMVNTGDEFGEKKREQDLGLIDTLNGQGFLHNNSSFKDGQRSGSLHLKT